MAYMPTILEISLGIFCISFRDVSECVKTELVVKIKT